MATLKVVFVLEADVAPTYAKNVVIAKGSAFCEYAAQRFCCFSIWSAGVKRTAMPFLCYRKERSGTWIYGGKEIS